ncbi:hypothetical protein GR198_20655 [Rhizobium leguminosarum]|uniref:DUF5343 domain-containing protein n=1 Tax=Rhizobium leguminosarum TaxID=384 RepID=UPI0013BFD18A|nr:DUF5343 domain-containing protein [Rhizobium leguminosarum]NEH58134.1 hypothetical protein [Rhizobium leguminosarum]
MPVTADRPAPYAPASAILALIQRHRTRGLPSYDADVLARAGVSSSLIPRTLQALQTLDLIGEDGRPSTILEGLRLAPEPEFETRLREWLTEAYSDALSYVDPAKDDEVRVRDAFRGYQPVGQQPRMVTLFMGLFAAAGITPEKPKTGSRKPNRPIAAKTPTQQKRKTQEEFGKSPQKTDRTPLSGDLPPALAGLLASLPSRGNSWSKQERDRFVNTFGAVLDFCFPVTRDEESEE